MSGMSRGASGRTAISPSDSVGGTIAGIGQVWRSPDRQRLLPACAAMKRPIARGSSGGVAGKRRPIARGSSGGVAGKRRPIARDRKSTRLNSSHANISYAVFCLKKKKKKNKKHNKKKKKKNKKKKKKKIKKK